MRYVIAVVAVVSLSACGGGSSTPTAPTAPVVQACVTNHTGTVTFRNVGGRTVDILWNNAVRATVTPGATSAEFTVVAGGAQYVMDAVITNTSVHPCQILVATPLQCQNNAYSTCGGF